jgi:signal transduction histidine kinase
VSEQPLRQYASSNHRTYRGAWVFFVTLLAVFAVGIVTTLPSVVAVTHVGATLVWAVCLAFVAVNALSTLAFARGGFESRAYQALNFTETLVATVGALVLVHESGHAFSVFWVLFFAVVLQAGSFGANVTANTIAFSLGPLALTIGFLVQGDAVSAASTALTGGVALAGYLTTVRATRKTVLASEQERRILEQERELSVLRERARIERDLHDGLGAELTALVYKVEASEGTTAERAELATRLRHVLQELRTVVWMLRRDNRTAGELVDWLRTRCAELSDAPVKVRFVEVDVEESRVLPGELVMHVIHVVLEAVRNATQHSGAKDVAITLRLRSQVEVQVRDDGRGLGEPTERLHGGLANLRARAQALGGKLVIDSTAEGMRVELTCPFEQRA